MQIYQTRAVSKVQAAFDTRRPISEQITQLIMLKYR